MRANPIVMAPPALNDDLSLAQRVEDFAVEKFVAQARIEALDVAVFPRTARRDVGGFRTDGRDRDCRKFRVRAMTMRAKETSHGTTKTADDSGSSA